MGELFRQSRVIVTVRIVATAIVLHLTPLTEGVGVGAARALGLEPSPRAPARAPREGPPLLAAAEEAEAGRAEDVAAAVVVGPCLGLAAAPVLAGCSASCRRCWCPAVAEPPPPPPPLSSLPPRRSTLAEMAAVAVLVLFAVLLALVLGLGAGFQLRM